MTIRERAEELLRDGFYDVDRDRLIEIYEAVFSQKLCPTCLKDHIQAYQKLKKWLREGAKTDTDMAKGKKYRFKKEFEGSRVPFPKYRTAVTAENLDEYAKIMLADPKRALMIEEIPTEPKTAPKAKFKNGTDNGEPVE